MIKAKNHFSIEKKQNFNKTIGTKPPQTAKTQ